MILGWSYDTWHGTNDYMYDVYIESITPLLSYPHKVDHNHHSATLPKELLHQQIPSFSRELQQLSVHLVYDFDLQSSSVPSTPCSVKSTSSAASSSFVTLDLYFENKS